MENQSEQLFINHHLKFVNNKSDAASWYLYVEDRLTQSTVNSINKEELCPFGCNKKQAVFVFIILLSNKQFHFM
ncbi:hypothetical protein KSF78_0005598 [Schistosoma japonicum]|nr:hypothetical protein KSF78_0005598 [Schistosoma japonicum]